MREDVTVDVSMTEVKVTEPGNRHAAPPDEGRSARATWLKASAGSAGVVLLPAALLLTLPGNALDSTNQMMLAAIGAIGLNLVMGHAGLVSVGNAAMLATGGLSAAQVSIYLGWPFLVAVLVAGLVAGAAGLLLSVFTFRLAGLYLAVATLAFHFIVVFAFQQIQSAQVGNSIYILPPADLFGILLAKPAQWLPVIYAVLLIIVFLYRRLLKGEPGRVWRAVREDLFMARYSGVSIGKYKMMAFAISSFIVGIAGGLSTYYAGVLTYESFTIDTAVLYITMVVLGGLGSIYGPIVGAAVMTLLPQVLKFFTLTLGWGASLGPSTLYLLQGATVGVVLVLLILFEPNGLAAIGPRIRDRWFRRPRARTSNNGADAA